MPNLDDILDEKREENSNKHQHVLNCIELELLDAKDGDEIKIVIQDNKAEIWNGNTYTGRHLYK